MKGEFQQCFPYTIYAHTMTSLKYYTGHNRPRYTHSVHFSAHCVCERLERTFANLVEAVCGMAQKSLGESRNLREG